MSLSNILRKRRKELGLTLAEIADKMDVSEATVQRWESGNIKNMRQERISRLAEVLHVTPAYLMGWEEEALLQPVVEHISQSMDAIRKAQQIAATLAGSETFDTAVLTHPNVAQLLDIAQDATQAELLDAVSYLEYQKSKR